MTQLCLLRHGQTDWNVEGRWQGHSDTPLNSTGLDQARQAAEELKSTAFESLYSSDLQRARETAQAVAHFHNLPVKIDARLRELNLGDWEGKLLMDVPQLYPAAWAERQAHPLESRPPGGESVPELAQRVQQAIDAICMENSRGPVLIVSHGLALATVLCLVQGHPLSEAYERIPSNAHPIYLDYQSRSA